MARESESWGTFQPEKKFWLITSYDGNETKFPQMNDPSLLIGDWVKVSQCFFLICFHIKYKLFELNICSFQYIKKASLMHT